MKANAFLKFSLLFVGIFLFFSLLCMGQQESEARKMLNRCVSSIQYRLTLEADVRRIIDRYISERELMRRHYELFDWHYSRRPDPLVSYYLFFNALQQSRDYEQLLRRYENLLSEVLENYEKRTEEQTEKRTETKYSISSESGEELGPLYVNKTGSTVTSIHYFPPSMGHLSKAMPILISTYKDTLNEIYEKNLVRRRPVKIRVFTEGKEFELIFDGTKPPELIQILRDKK